ncbi:hypothetical protein CLF_106479 [Clonorchis sinensis]|uniref:C2H2-type domain-containing protein n=1 Tax=Clonorchis sinensis TaxID=79923 RepID=G7YF90_CLOSI|nr:hypothetical protein CLF_106479 [Clonorchis sinensis]
MALCTEEADRTAAQIEVMNKLRGSGYPASLIRRQLRRVLVPVAKPKREWLGTAVITYKPGTSEIIRRILNTANIRDRLLANRTRDCVCKIKCNDCIKVYMGQTARELHTRIGEHKRKINRPPRNADEYQALIKDSAIAEHALDCARIWNLDLNLENVEVFRRGLRSTSQRLMAKAVEIVKHPSVNRIEGVELDFLIGAPSALYVCKIKCNDCIKVYMGQTARELHTRIGEHKRKINRPPRNADEYQALIKDSAIAEHALDCARIWNLDLNLENVEVFRRGLRSTSQRLMAEAVEIVKHPSVNRIEGVELVSVWRTALEQSS